MSFKVLVLRSEAGSLEQNIAFKWLEDHALEIDALIWKDLRR